MEERRLLYLCNTIQFNTVQYNTTQHNTAQYNAIQYSAIHCSAVQYNTRQCTIQYNTTQYNTKLYSFPLLFTSQHSQTIHESTTKQDKYQIRTKCVAYVRYQSPLYSRLCRVAIGFSPHLLYKRLQSGGWIRPFQLN